MEIRRQNALYSLDNMVDSKIPIKAINNEDWKVETDYEFFADEEVIQSDSLYSEVLQEIKNLPEHYREIIEDRIVDKMKYKDIAVKRGLKINTVRSRIHSAKKVIKNLWIDKKIKSNSSKTINIVGVTILQLLDDNKERKNKKTEIEGPIVTITAAKYGAGTTWFDVTEKAIKLLEDKHEVKASNRLGGDPCYGEAKTFIVEYTRDGKSFVEEIKEGKYFK